MKHKLVVGITQGDSNGIGYEVIIKALSDPRILDMLTPVVYGSSKIFSFYRKSIPEIEQMDTNAISSAADAHEKRVNIVGCLPDNVFAEPGGATADSAKAAITATDWIGLILVSFVLPAVICPLINMLCRKMGWVKDGDMTLA